MMKNTWRYDNSPPVRLASARYTLTHPCLVLLNQLDLYLEGYAQ